MKSEQLLEKIDHVLPGFRDYFNSKENVFDSKTLAGIFSACSMYVREQTIPADAWRKLADLSNDSAVGGTELKEAVCTCFLENLAEKNHPMKAFLQGEALKYWEAWESP